MIREKQLVVKFVVLCLGLALFLAGCSFVLDLEGEREGSQNKAEKQEENFDGSTIPVNEKVTKENGKVEVGLNQPPRPTGKTKLSISVVGDIMVHMHQLKAARQEDGTYDFKDVFEVVKPYIEKADVAIGNLETTISNDERGYTAYPCFKSPESILQALKYAGFDVITTANNHSLDATEFGVRNTLDKLDQYGLLHTGTARTPEDRDQILVIEKNGIKVAVLAYTYGTNGMEAAMDQEKLSYMVNYLDNTEAIERDIERARESGAEIVIACVHWGTEYVRQPNENQEKIADKLFALGVDIIFGSHPHVLQPMEKRTITTKEGKEKEGFIIYSLGNFISNQRDRYKDSGVIVNLEIVKDYDKNNISIGEIHYIPTWVYRYTEKGKLKYRVLPVYDYMEKDLKGDAEKRIKEVWKETTQHLDTDEIKAWN